MTELWSPSERELERREVRRRQRAVSITVASAVTVVVFGLLFQKGNPLVPCVNEALAALKADGTLAQLEQEWLSNVVDVPVLQ